MYEEAWVYGRVHYLIGHRFAQTRPPRVAKHCGQVNTHYFFTTKGTKDSTGVNWACPPVLWRVCWVCLDRIYKIVWIVIHRRERPS